MASDSVGLPVHLLLRTTAVQKCDFPRPLSRHGLRHQGGLLEVGILVVRVQRGSYMYLLAMLLYAGHGSRVLRYVLLLTHENLMLLVVEHA